MQTCKEGKEEVQQNEGALADMLGKKEEGMKQEVDMAWEEIAVALTS